MTDAELEAIAAALEHLRAPKRKPRQGSSTPPAPTTFTQSRRMWVLTFHDLDGWLNGYDPDDLATSATAAEWAAFERVLTQIALFAVAGRTARDSVLAMVQERWR